MRKRRGNMIVEILRNFRISHTPLATLLIRDLFLLRRFNICFNENLVNFSAFERVHGELARGDADHCVVDRCGCQTIAQPHGERHGGEK